MMVNYFPVKLEFLIKDKFYDSDIFLKIGDDYVHYLSAGEGNKEQLETLLSRNCEQVYLNYAAVKEYMQLKKTLLARELLNEKDNIQCLDQFTNNYRLLKDFYIGIVSDEIKAEYIQELGKQSAQILEKNSFLNTLFQKFKDGSPSQMIFKEMVSFLSIFSLKYFDTIGTDQLEKFNVAILMTDLFLEEDEIEATYVAYNSEIPQRILRHPQRAIEFLPKETYFKSSTIINLIKNHHELPSGNGYPNRISYTRFDLFLCTYYISEQIIFKLIKKELKLNQIKDVYKEVVAENKKYATPNFKRAFSNFDQFLLDKVKKND